MKLVRDLVGGFFMAVANSVPGVSGGTIALLLGFYDKLIEAVSDLVFHKGKRLKGLVYILRVGGGWAVGMVISILVLDRILDSHIYSICSLFFGFILFSIPFTVFDERKCLKGRYYYMFFAFIGFIIIAGMSWTSAIKAAESNTSIDFKAVTVGLLFEMFAVGIFSTVALLLPGVSGSTVFLAFGVYYPIMKFLRSLIAFDMPVIIGSLPAFTCLGLGAAVGGFFGIKGINFCLKKFRKQTVYFTVGMLAGSLVSILVAPMTAATPEGMPPNPMMGFGNFDWVCFFVGATLVCTLQILRLKREKKLAAILKEEENGPDVTDGEEKDGSNDENKDE